MARALRDGNIKPRDGMLGSLQAKPPTPGPAPTNLYLQWTKRSLASPVKSYTRSNARTWAGPRTERGARRQRPGCAHYVGSYPPRVRGEPRGSVGSASNPLLCLLSAQG